MKIPVVFGNAFRGCLERVLTLRFQQEMEEGLDASKLCVICADDEEVFCDIASAAIMQAGVKEENLYLASDGLEAFEAFQKLEGVKDNLILMILDLRMPGMDGKTCAQKVGERVAERNNVLPKPFLVCCSSSIAETTVEKEGEVFHMSMKKPFNASHVGIILEEWRSRLRAVGEKSAACAGSQRQEEVPPENLDVIIADDEPTCRMALELALTRLGVNGGSIVEADDDEELLEALGAAKSGDPTRPLVVFAGKSCWTDAIGTFDIGKRAPFMVAIAEGAATESAFHTWFPRAFQEQDLKDLLAKACAWQSQRQ